MTGKERETRLERAKASLAAGADQVKEKTQDALSGAREKTAEAVRIVRESKPDEQTREKARHATERGLDRAGDAVSGAAPAIGRGAEYAAEKVGAALKFAARPLGVVIGAIGGVVGGWWKSARHENDVMPTTEQEACRAHFVTLAIDGMSFDDARSGYTFGYIAGCNPDYSGRSYEEIEPDLRHGFTDAEAEYDAIREFARFGYGRGTGQPDSGSITP